MKETVDLKLSQAGLKSLLPTLSISVGGNIYAFSTDNPESLMLTMDRAEADRCYLNSGWEIVASRPYPETYHEAIACGWSADLAAMTFPVSAQ